MNREDLYNSITDLPDDMVEQARSYHFRKIPWKRITALAAALAICLGLGAMATLDWSLLPWPSRLEEAPTGEDGLKSPAETPAEIAAGPESYAGPVLPLTVWGGELAAERTITVDLTEYHLADITDQYVLTNETDSDQNVTLLYPVVGSFTSPADILPTLTVDGEPIETELKAGDYVGGFHNTDGTVAQTPDEMWNLFHGSYAEDYSQCLTDETYLQNALAEYTLPDNPVVVYTIDLPEDAAQQVEFTCTVPDGVVVIPLGYRMGGSEGRQHSYTFMKRHSSIAELLVLGGDIADPALDGAAYTRTESTLGDRLLQAVSYPLGYQPDFETVADRASPELIARCAARWMEAYGPFGETPAIRYQVGLETELLEEPRTATRLFFTAVEVTVPAHGSITLEAALKKEASFNYGEPEEEYELWTQSGTGLTLNSQLLNLEHTDGLDIWSYDFVTAPLTVSGRTTDIEIDPQTPCLPLRIRRPE